MTDRPILFSAPMIRALLDGRKTQTRRLVKLRSHPGAFQFGKSETPGHDWTFRRKDHVWEDFKHKDLIKILPHQAGDCLWVRENCRAWEVDHTGEDMVQYCADDQSQRIQNTADAADRWIVMYNYGCSGPKNRVGQTVPSIHMPRWASRITLAVTDVRIERLQSISEADAVAEGGPKSHPSIDRVSNSFGYPDFSRSWFAQLWNSIHGPEAWDANPWVVATSFTVHRCNIDAMPADGQDRGAQ